MAEVSNNTPYSMKHISYVVSRTLYDLWGIYNRNNISKS